MKTIAVIDYGMGNLHSVSKALEHVASDQQVVVTSDPEVIRNAEHVVLPGVGAIRDCMAEIRRLGVDKVVQENIASGKPFLGICVGYQALMLAPPIYCLPQENEIIQHYKTASAETDMPIIMYNFPARSGVEISVEAVIELAQDKNIVGIKESSGDFSRALSLITAQLDDFEVVCGSDDQAADYLFWGVRSWIGGVANYLPAEHVQLIEAAKAGDYDRLRSIMQRIMPVIKNQESDDYNQKAKLGCAHIGYPVGQVRAPLLPISADDEAEFINVLTAALQ